VNRENIFRKLYQNQLDREKWLNSVPSEIQMVFWSTPYIDSCVRDRNMMMKYVFGEHLDAIDWFLYDWQPGYEVDETPIRDIDHYIEFLKQTQGFE
jgi:hypothetical protein